MKLYKIGVVATVVLFLVAMGLFVAATWTYGVPVPGDMTSQKLGQTGALTLVLTVIFGVLSGMAYEADK